MTQWGLYFNIILVVHTLFHWCCSTWTLWVKKSSTADMMSSYFEPINFSAHPKEIINIWNSFLKLRVVPSPSHYSIMIKELLVYTSTSNIACKLWVQNFIHTIIYGIYVRLSLSRFLSLSLSLIYIYIYIYIIFTNLSARAGYDTRSVFLSGV